MAVLSWLFGYPRPGSDAHSKTSTTSPVPHTPAAPTIPPPSPVSTPSEQPQEPNHFFSKRSLRQLGLFAGGAGFFFWSVLISRRAIVRHQIAAKLKFYQSNQCTGRSEKDLPKKDPLVAVEALNLATLNTLSFAIMAVGGVSWAFDISNMGDLRRYARRSVVTVGGMVDAGEEQEVVAWMAKAFGIEDKVASEEESKSRPEDDGKR
ncbi:hypothetical protein C8A05DRAFT_11672 [Staphylotrichum tortipilum]|uniref:Altered inheritance of mitochondria protein 11 n=1 Tax=Staphylotrichum tortipilum TaxID=2831512 RepID=A0AAN6RXN8_9PEZI|nr:hypothetical protein C8A05DRAFT_11672 [Staphylotrichum longicolle]